MTRFDYIASRLAESGVIVAVMANLAVQRRTAVCLIGRLSKGWLVGLPHVENQSSPTVKSVAAMLFTRRSDNRDCLQKKSQLMH